MGTLILDSLTRAGRRLRRDPGFSAVAVGTLGIAIAAAATVFAIFDSMLLRPLPYGEPDRLVLVWQQTDAGTARRGRIAAPDADRIGRDAAGIQELAFIADSRDGVVEIGGRTDHIRLGQATGDLFDVLAVGVHAGRPFRPGESRISADVDASLVQGVIVLSFDTWMARFGGDPAIAGRTIHIDGTDYVIAGVAQPDFRVQLPPDAGIDTDVDAWTALRVPLADMRRPDRLVDQDTDNTGAVIARLEPGISIELARQELAAVAARMREDNREYESAGFRLIVAPMHHDVTAHARPALLAIMAAVALALLVACLNVAGLLVARAAARRREMAVRSALGGTASRIAGPVMAECAILAAAGAGSGLILAGWAIDLVRGLAPAGSGIQGASLGTATVAFTGAVAVFTLLLSGTVSVAATPLRGDAGALRQRGSGAGGRGSLRRGLAIGQIAISLALLVGTGLLLRTFESLADVDPGFRPERLLTFELAMPGASVGGPADRSRLMRAIADRIGDVPGVERVGITGGLPLGGQRFTQPWGTAGDNPVNWNRRQANFRVVSSDYFGAVGTRILAGRVFTRDEDLIEDARVAIVSRALALALEPSGDAVGREISFPLDGQPVTATVVGVADDVRFDNLESAGLPTIYVPYRQEASRRVGFAVRTTSDPRALEGAIRNAIRDVDGARDLPAWAFHPMREFIGAETAPARFSLFVSATFGAIALLLTTLSVYAFITWLVREREAEIGVRIALGASPRDVLRQFAAVGARIAATGLLTGLIPSLAVSRVLTGLLFGVSPLDPAIHIGVITILAAATGLASLLPARRAALTDPATVLRRD
jgi:putative ABC transport system permease protein